MSLATGAAGSLGLVSERKHCRKTDWNQEGGQSADHEVGARFSQRPRSAHGTRDGCADETPAQVWDAKDNDRGEGEGHRVSDEQGVDRGRKLTEDPGGDSKADCTSKHGGRGDDGIGFADLTSWDKAWDRCLFGRLNDRIDGGKQEQDGQNQAPVTADEQRSRNKSCCAEQLQSYNQAASRKPIHNPAGQTGDRDGRNCLDDAAKSDNASVARVCVNRDEGSDLSERITQ